MLYEKAMPEIGEENAAIFEVHRMMLRDSYYQETIENIIRSQGVNAEYAVGNRTLLTILQECLKSWMMTT